MRVISWFSCGVTRAVATKLAVQKYGDAVVAAYIDTGSEHVDNKRFLRDSEQWIGKGITILRSDKYKDVDAVIERSWFMRGPRGARCTAELKKKVRYAFQLPEDLQIFGYHRDEKNRAARFTQANQWIDLEYPLIDQDLTHADCMTIIMHAGIEIPKMYQLGFNNNNCIGCVKAESATYWNRVRREFPDVFAKRAEQERKCNFALVRQNKRPVFLDELDPDAGRADEEIAIQCGLLCDIPISEVLA